MKYRTLLVGMICCAGLSGCFYDLDRDRIDELKSGEGETEDTGTNAVPGDKDGGSGEVQGLGDECSDQSGCEDNDADYCAMDPMNPSEPGYCTITGCTGAVCAEGYLCCDCRNSPQAPEQIDACIQTAQAALLSIICACE